MGKKINISIHIPYSLDVELPEGKTIDNVLGLFSDSEIRFIEKDTEGFSSIFLNRKDFKRSTMTGAIDFYDYESKTIFTHDELSQRCLKLHS